MICSPPSSDDSSRPAVVSLGVVVKKVVVRLEGAGEAAGVEDVSETSVSSDSLSVSLSSRNQTESAAEKVYKFIMCRSACFDL